MSVESFNLVDKQLAERKLLVTAVNTGTSSEPVWEVVGVRVEDSSIDYNPDTETFTDILGITYTDIKKTEPAQDVEPFTIRGGSILAAQLDDIMQRNALSELSLFDVLVIRGFYGTSTNGYKAEKHSGCTIEVKSIGGDSNVNMPICIHYSNDKTFGTVNSLKSPITFTED
ncbi:MAG: hypothetical protein PUB08_07630 [Firmicutes bacterium]|nr:hypothetical protein [Bacillota bacterium]